MNDNLTRGKKINSFIAETGLENVKQDYVAFLPPRNLNKNHGIFMFFFFFKKIQI